MSQQLTIPQALAASIQLYQAGQLQQAREICRKLLQVDPNQIEATYISGLIEYQLGNIDAAAAMLQHAISLQPNFPDAWNTLGAVLQLQNKSDESLAAFNRAVELRPDFADAHYNLGHAHRQAGRLDESIASFRRSLQFNPQQADAHNSVGVVLYSKRRFDDALVEFHRSLELRPDFAEAHNNVGLTLQAQGHYDRAAGAYQAAIAARPDYPMAHYNLSTIFLVKGDFERGWREYEYRWQVPETGLIPRRFTQSRWDGSPLQGKRILIHSEQGLGDAIQFARYIPLISTERGGRVILACQTELLRLMQSLPNVERVIPLSEPFTDFDIHCPLGTLPLMFKTTLASIPTQIPYLHATPDKIESWHQRLSQHPGTKIGLVWAGRSKHLNDHNRSIALDALSPLADVPNATFISLQLGSPAAQIRNPSNKLPLIDWTSELHDLADTAALIENLDLVITVDTSVAHLAGALGKPTWLLLPFVPDWRWLIDRDDSPWYPTMKLFRQPSLGDWVGTIARVSRSL